MSRVLSPIDKASTAAELSARRSADDNLAEARAAIDEGRAWEALEWAEKAAAGFAWLGDPVGVAYSAIVQAVTLAKRGLWAPALDALAEIERFAVQRRTIELQARINLARSSIEVKVNSTERALATLARAQGFAELSGDGGLIGEMLLHQAQMVRAQYFGNCMVKVQSLRCGVEGDACKLKLLRSEELAKACRDKWKSLDDPVRLARVNIMIGDLRAELGDKLRARRFCERAGYLLRSSDRVIPQAELKMLRGRLYGMDGRHAEQIKCLEAAAELAESALAREYTARAHELLSQAHEQAGSLDRALYHARKHLEQYKLWEAQQGRDLLRVRENNIVGHWLAGLGLHTDDDGPTDQRPKASGISPTPVATTPEPDPHAEDPVRVALRMGLTMRRIEILQRLVEGQSATMIAEDLGLSPKTVQNHLQRIYKTLGVQRRTGAVAWWASLAAAHRAPIAFPDED
ncbi:helix-turn-helix transcriptional regulator [Allokutzneria sp. NRRL B-24872]|uniref:helix-turn-helix transcriptional regulator n=1 Tax=Allokutzneria sp. NRRL B-24872 TaxID=1137961 RepID=UPI001178CCC8|nr:helix-turn-helix transcriptional regulator [Allokutzneria sp. NRRL B-24872]